MSICYVSNFFILKHVLAMNIFQNYYWYCYPTRPKFCKEIYIVIVRCVGTVDSGIRKKKLIKDDIKEYLRLLIKLCQFVLTEISQF